VKRRRFQHGPLKQIWYLFHVTDSIKFVAQIIVLVRATPS
jgi:hypothetical protein